MKTKPKIGLALGSGGPRGLAHIGVLKVLIKHNIPIDFIAGSSIGAMVGGFYAILKDINKIEKISLNVNWRQVMNLIDPTLNLGFITGNKVKKYLESYIDRTNFKDCKIPFSVVATDIKHGDTVVINKGEVASAIRASISLPLIFRPIHQESEMLTDGGLSMPVPVEVVKKMGADIVIAVNLDNDYFTNNKNGKLGFYRIAYNSIYLLRHHLAVANIKDADVVINPKVGNARWDNFLNSKEIIAAGEEAATKMLPKLKKLL